MQKFSMSLKVKMIESNGEKWMKKPLLEWLERRRRVRHDTIVRCEFPWFLRHIDLVTLTCSGAASAYELKLNNNRRAIHQAAYNKLVFDRSYVVTASEPTEEMLRYACDVGVGFIVFKENCVKMVQESPRGQVPGTLRKRLHTTIKSTRVELNV